MGDWVPPSQARSTNVLSNATRVGEPSVGGRSGYSGPAPPSAASDHPSFAATSATRWPRYFACATSASVGPLPACPVVTETP